MPRKNPEPGKMQVSFQRRDAALHHSLHGSRTTSALATTPEQAQALAAAANGNRVVLVRGVRIPVNYIHLSHHELILRSASDADLWVHISETLRHKKGPSLTPDVYLTLFAYDLNLQTRMFATARSILSKKIAGVQHRHLFAV